MYYIFLINYIQKLIHAIEKTRFGTRNNCGKSKLLT